MRAPNSHRMLSSTCRWSVRPFSNHRLKLQHVWKPLADHHRANL